LIEVVIWYYRGYKQFDNYCESGFSNTEATTQALTSPSYDFLVSILIGSNPRPSIAWVAPFLRALFLAISRAAITILIVGVAPLLTTPPLALFPWYRLKIQTFEHLSSLLAL
jgi:hypothetical protein